jgi:hypothetical protein
MKATIPGTHGRQIERERRDDDGVARRWKYFI